MYAYDIHTGTVHPLYSLDQYHQVAAIVFGRTRPTEAEARAALKQDLSTRINQCRQ